MPTVNFSPMFNSQVVDSTGAPASGWKVYAYLANSSTPQDTYTTHAGDTTQSNPIVLNSLGFPTTGQIWLVENISYKLVLTDASDVVQKTEDYISGVTVPVAGSNDQWVSYGTAPTYISATSFSVPGDQRTTFNVGRRLKTTNTGGTIYSTITASVYGALTTVTVVNDSGTLDSGLSAVSYGLLSSENTSMPVRRDVVSAFADTADPTKFLKLEVSNIPTGTTVTQTTGGGGILPAGIGPLPYAGSSVPTGWLECDGSAVSRTTYVALFTAISTTWGAGNGSTTFNLPDMRGKVAIGDGTGTSTESVTDASINTGTDRITVTSNATKWITGMTVVWTVTGTQPTTNPANLLDNGDTVYVIRISATEIQFATSIANAQAGTAIDITAAGSGTFTMTHTYTARTLGQYGGEEGHAPVAAEVGPHTHLMSVYTTGGGATQDTVNSTAGANTEVATDANTAGAAMNIMQPFAVVKYIISY